MNDLLELTVGEIAAPLGSRCSRGNERGMRGRREGKEGKEREASGHYAHAVIELQSL
jgi:hypothetical protein